MAMTEERWLEAKTIIDLHIYYSAPKRHRKWRLFSCACARRVLQFVPDDRFSMGVEEAERFADGGRTWDDIKTVRKAIVAARRQMQKGTYEFLHSSAIEVILDASLREPSDTLKASWGAAGVFGTANQPEFREGYASEEQVVIGVARDIFGNPFRPVAFAPEWRSATAVALAESMYAARDFGPMPVLADALEEAGCDHADVLAHCRGDGSHVRGCWVVDLVLGKS